MAQPNYPPYSIQQSCPSQEPYQRPYYPQQPQSYPPQPYPAQSYSPQSYPRYSYPPPQNSQPSPFQLNYAPQQQYSQPQYYLQPIYSQPHHSPQTGYAAPQHHHQSHTQSPLKLYWGMSAKHTRTLTPEHSSQPLYVISHDTQLFTSGPEFTITSTAQNNLTVGTVNWHGWSGKVDLSFPSRGALITYRENFDSLCGLGRLFWSATEASKKGATMKLVDRKGDTLATVTLENKLESGLLEIWRAGLGKDAYEEVVVSAVAAIEEVRKSIKEGDAGAIGTIAGASAGTSFSF